MVSLLKAVVAALMLTLGVSGGTPEVPFEPYICSAGEDFMSTLYSGVVDVPVLVQSDEYFNTVAERAGWEFAPAGVYTPSTGEISIREAPLRRPRR